MNLQLTPYQLNCFADDFKLSKNGARILMGHMFYAICK